jgi:branched-chain amino acid transport system ATP-binding protein
VGRGAAVILLRTAALSRNFGGVEAVKGVDLSLPEGEVRAVIGPNGAGKTTLASMISGRIRPSSGRIFFKEQDVTGQRSWQRARSGIVYTFQITSIFQNLTCHDNVALALQRPLMRGIGSRIHLDAGLMRRKVEAVLARVALAEDIDRPAATLPYAHQRQLEMAMSLALAPELLIMDEPTQGLSEREIAAFCDLVRDIAREVTVMLIEHNLPVVMALADRITVMDRGIVLAEGTPGEVQANAEVQRAYLGV